MTSFVDIVLNVNILDQQLAIDHPLPKGEMQLLPFLEVPS